MRKLADLIPLGDLAELNQALRAVENSQGDPIATARARLDLYTTVGRIGQSRAYGVKAALGRHCGWSNERVGQLVKSYRADRRERVSA